MSRLLLLRHAKAAWAAPGAHDFDRPLEKSGRMDAIAAGIEMAAADLTPDLVLCSTAKRARETWECVAGAFHDKPIRIKLLESLYSDDAAGYLATIAKSGECDCVMVVGHNPMMEDLTEALSREGNTKAHARLSSGFPTCGLAVLSFDGPLSAAGPGNGELEQFIVR